MPYDVLMLAAVLNHSEHIIFRIYYMQDVMGFISLGVVGCPDDHLFKCIHGVVAAVPHENELNLC